ncbi:MAG: class I SAM-dependent methyltransferase [Patescibacteria group bacterium]
MKNHNIKEFYNYLVDGETYRKDFEFNRWFIRARNRAEYAMTYIAIKAHTANLKFTNCLEVGPGPGTWTRLLYRTNPKAEFNLVDISEAMREQFYLEMRDLPNVKYRVQDVMEYNEDIQYDLFFSSRAVEYFDDKPEFFKKLSKLVVNKGRGVMVTKNPYHGVRKDKGEAHQGQIPMPKMKEMLEDNGFSNVRFYPAVIRIPIISRFTSELAEYLFEKRINREIDIHKINRIVESYIVTFTK